jgi:VWFA-related protein
MRSLFLLLLLLPSSLSTDIKILVPVVVKDSAGNAVTDLKVSDFQVSGPKSSRVVDMSLVSAETSRDDKKTQPLFVIYDAANIPTSSTQLNIRDMRDFLSEVASHSLPITFLVNTKAGLQQIYNPQTPPTTLAAALEATAQPPTLTVDGSGDPGFQEQVNSLKLLGSAALVNRPRVDAAVDQIQSLEAFARMVGDVPGHKALVWVTTASPVSATQDPGYWSTTTYQPGSTSDGSMRADKPLLPAYEALVAKLNASHISVYPFFFSQANPQNDQVLWASWLGLKQLAESTGGLAYRLGQQTSLSAAVHSTISDFGPYYMLVVEVPAAKQLDWIPLHIKANRPGLTVRAAPGFLSVPAKTK